MTTADEFKAQGNAALQAKKFSEAIEHYTSAINLDGTNHIYYSNRSAAYLSKGDALNALEDANSCITLKPDFSKGYSRKGAALHSLKRYNDSIASYNEGLEKFPGDAALKKGLDSVEREMNGPPPGTGGGMGGGAGGMPPGMGSLFGPDMMAKIALDPKLRGYMADPDFMAKVQLLQKDPNQISTMLGDPKILELFQAILGMNGMEMRTGDGDDAEEAKADATSSSSSATPPSEPKPAAEAPKKEETPAAPTPMEEDDNLTDDQKAAIKAKEKGNTLYKSKKFDDALAAYEEAITLDPTNMTFVSNKAAVYFTTKKYDECIETCKRLSKLVRRIKHRLRIVQRF